MELENLIHLQAKDAVVLMSIYSRSSKLAAAAIIIIIIIIQ